MIIIEITYRHDEIMLIDQLQTTPPRTPSSTLPYRPPSIISSRPWLPPLLDRVSHEYDSAARASWYDEIVIASLIISYQDGGGGGGSRSSSSSSRWWWTFKLDQDSPMGGEEEGSSSSRRSGW